MFFFCLVLAAYVGPDGPDWWLWYHWRHLCAVPAGNWQQAVEGHSTGHGCTVQSVGY